MELKVFILVLGEYTEVSKFVEGVPLVHEDFLLNSKGDLYNIKYKYCADKFSLDVKGEDIDIKDMGDLSEANAGTKDFLLNILFGNNGCRRRSEEDMIGLYGYDSTVEINLEEEGPEDVAVEVYFNYLNKSQLYEGEPLLLYIIDNTESNNNTLNNVDYLVRKAGCETVLVTTSPVENFKSLQDNLKKDGIVLEIQPFNS